MWDLVAVTAVFFIGVPVGSGIAIAVVMLAMAVREWVALQARAYEDAKKSRDEHRAAAEKCVQEVMNAMKATAQEAERVNRFKEEAIRKTIPVQ
jgi:thymidylate synthase ThyX